MNEHAKSSHPLPIDENVRTRDVLAEILTLVQIAKTRRIPILPVQRLLPGRYHPLVPGHRGARGWPSARPPELFEGGQSPGSSGCYFQDYEHRGFGLSAEEQEILLHP